MARNWRTLLLNLLFLMPLRYKKRWFIWLLLEKLKNDRIKYQKVATQNVHEFDSSKIVLRDSVTDFCRFLLHVHDSNGLDAVTIGTKATTTKLFTIFKNLENSTMKKQKVASNFKQILTWKIVEKSNISFISNFFHQQFSMKIHQNKMVVTFWCVTLQFKNTVKSKVPLEYFNIQQKWFDILKNLASWEALP